MTKWKIKKASDERTVTMSVDEYVEILQMLWNNMNWNDEFKQSLFPKLIDFVINVDYGNNESPKKMLDRYINYAEIITKEDDFQPGDSKFEEYNGNWEEYCNNEAVFYNDKYACLSF